MVELPYGTWPSPVGAADLTRSALRLAAGITDNGVHYWAQGDPTQGGRVSLWAQTPGAAAVELTPEHQVRTGIHEYGGGAWTVAAGIVAWSSWPDGSLWVLEPGAAPRRIVAVAGLRFGSLWLDPSRRLLLAVREDHRDSDREAITTIVGLNLDGDNSDGGQVLVRGADFYAHPSIAGSGLLAWCEWDHPAMPWDATRIVVAPVADTSQRTVVAGGAEVSALYPAWTDDSVLLYLDDSSGYWNFYRWDGASHLGLYPASWDFCGPLWVPDPVPYAILDERQIGCTWFVDGFTRVGVLEFDPQSAAPGVLRPLELGTVTAQVSGRGPLTPGVFGFADRPSELAVLDWAQGRLHTLRRAAQVSLDPSGVSHAEPVRWDSPDGEVHGWFYRPTNASCQATVGELPPVQVWIHGGPTGMADPAFDLAVQFWTSRGIGILDVNYSGSTGYGRAYRERLKGNWGIVDVRDCIDGARALVAQGLADPKRLSIRGGSAGGFTTLAALTSSQVFAAGISLYGVGDLEALALDTHKFESRYLDGLIAPYPAERQVYLERSPLLHLDQLNCPILLFQGRLDKVVPPEQAQSIADAVAARGLPVELVWFDNEDHGFRQASSIITVAERSLAFLGRVHGWDAQSR